MVFAFGEPRSPDDTGWASRTGSKSGVADYCLIMIVSFAPGSVSVGITPNGRVQVRQFLIVFEDASRGSFVRSGVFSRRNGLLCQNAQTSAQCPTRIRQMRKWAGGYDSTRHPVLADKPIKFANHIGGELPAGIRSGEEINRSSRIALVPQKG